MCDLVKEYAEKKLPRRKKRHFKYDIYIRAKRKSTIEEGAKDADTSQSEFIKAMTAVGYKLPDGKKLSATT